MADERGPIYQLKFALEIGVLRLDPYPMRKSSPRLKRRSMWPCIDNISMSLPTLFLHTSCGPSGDLDYTAIDIVRLMETAEHFWDSRRRRDCALNAYLLHNPVSNDRLALPEDVQKKLGIFENYLIIPISLFHIEVK